MEPIDVLAACEHYLLCWNLSSDVPFDNIEARMKKVNKLKVSTNSDDRGDNNGAYYRVKNLQSSLVPFVQLFLEIVAEELEKAKQTLEDVQTVINAMEFDQRYFGGLTYLHELVKIHFKLAFQNVPGYEDIQDYIQVRDPLPTVLDLNAEYSGLEKQNKCVIVLARRMLNLTHKRSSRDKGLRMMRQIIELDPENWYWYYISYDNIHFMRRNPDAGADKDYMPSTEEIEMVSNALKYVGSDQAISRLNCNAILCQCLAEIVACQHSKGLDEPVVLDKPYDCVNKMVEHIKNSASAALPSQYCGFNDFIRFGEILGITLPHGMRDYKTSLEFLKKGNTKHNNSSKGHHKMGVVIVNILRMKQNFLHNIDETERAYWRAWEGSMKDAIFHFEKAIEHGPDSFPARTDLLPALMRDYEENKDKIENVLDDALTNDHQWSNNEFGAFYFYKACYKFLTGSDVEAVKLLRDAMEKKFDGFKDLGRIKSRYGWRNYQLTFDHVLDILDNVSRRETDGNVLDEISDVRDCVAEAQKKTNEFYRRRNSRQN